MHIEDFIRGLEESGFTRHVAPNESEVMREIGNDFCRSFKPPKRLAGSLSFLNIGHTRDSRDGKFIAYYVRLQGPTYEELLTAFGPDVAPITLDPNDELLAALQLDGLGFMGWLGQLPLAIGTRTDKGTGETPEDFIMRQDGGAEIVPRKVQ